MKVDSPKASIGIYCHDIGEAILRPWEAAGGQQTDNGGLSCSLSSLLRSGIYLTSCSILPLRPRERERERESGRGPNGGGEMTAARRWERSGSRPHGREGSDWLPSDAGCFITIFQCFQLSLFCWLTLGGFKLDLASDQNVYQTQEILDSLLCLPWS